MDYILNGMVHGDVADKLLASGMNPLVLRPFWDPRTRHSYVTMQTGYKQDGSPDYRNYITNAPATLSYEAWKLLDTAVQRALRLRLVVWDRLSRSGLTYNVPNAMGKPVIQHQTMTDAGNATISMDGLREAERDRPLFDTALFPLPIIHADFSFSLREIEVSRQGIAPLDTTMAEQSARKCAETLEKLTLGTLSSYSYGGGTVYGLTNHPDRLTATLTLPTAAGWTPDVLVTELLAAFQSLRDAKFFGPYGVFMSPGWAQYLDRDYSSAYAGETLRTRIAKFGRVSWWEDADYLSDFQIVIVQLTQDVIQCVNGMDLMTLQWDSQGGLAKNFKNMMIKVPRIRANTDGDAGVWHGTGA